MSLVKLLVRLLRCLRWAVLLELITYLYLVPADNSLSFGLLAGAVDSCLNFVSFVGRSVLGDGYVVA